METQDVCDLLHRARRARQEFLGFLQADLAMILFRAKTDSFGESLSQVRVAHPEFGGDRGQTEAFLAAKRD